MIQRDLRLVRVNASLWLAFVVSSYHELSQFAQRYCKYHFPIITFALKISSQKWGELAVYKILVRKRANLFQIICCLMSNTRFINWLIFGMVRFERATKLDCTFLYKNKTITQTHTKNESPSFFRLAISMLYMPPFNLKLFNNTAFGFKLKSHRPVNIA